MIKAKIDCKCKKTGHKGRQVIGMNYYFCNRLSIIALQMNFISEIFV